MRNTLSIVWSAKFYEVQKYLSSSSRLFASAATVINKAKFDALSPQLREALLLSSAKEAGDYQRKLVAEDQQKLSMA